MRLGEVVAERGRGTQTARPFTSDRDAPPDTVLLPSDPCGYRLVGAPLEVKCCLVRSSARLILKESNAGMIADLSGSPRTKYLPSPRCHMQIQAIIHVGQVEPGDLADSPQPITQRAAMDDQRLVGLRCANDIDPP